MQSLRTAAAGLSGQQAKIDIIANNIANINTIAFKSSDANFEDTLYSVMEDPSDAAATANLQKGTGVKLASVSADFSQGSMMATENKLDFAINGDGFFKLLTEDGEYVYTRDGAFSISSEEDGGSYLVNSRGHYVIDENDEKIEAYEDGVLSIQSDGTVTTDSGETRLGIYIFSNPNGLASAGGNLFSETVTSGNVSPAEDYSVSRGYLEGSNVELAEELTNLIKSQRIFSLASKALQTADNMEGLANNIRG